MPRRKRRIRWSAIVAGAVTVVGILSDPHVLAILPAQASTAIAIAGVILQAITKPVKREPHEA